MMVEAVERELAPVREVEIVAVVKCEELRMRAPYAMVKVLLLAVVVVMLVLHH